MQPHGVMFHHFHDDNHAGGQGSLSADELSAIIRFLDPSRILSAREWLNRATSDTLDPHQLCLTFDDNLRCQYDVALPVLRDFGLTAFWFVPTCVLKGQYVRLELYRQFRVGWFDEVDDFYEAFFRTVATSVHAEAVERALGQFDSSTYLAQFPFYSEADRRFRYVRDEVLGPRRYDHVMETLIGSMGVEFEALRRDVWMGHDELRALHREGHVLGLHTHTHPTRLARLSPQEQLREYRDNYMCLLSLLGEAPTVVAHPCNSYSQQTLAVLQRLGVNVGFRANMRLSAHSKLEYPREDQANILREMRRGGVPYSAQSTALVCR